MVLIESDSDNAGITHFRLANACPINVIFKTPPPQLPAHLLRFLESTGSFH